MESIKKLIFNPFFIFVFYLLSVIILYLMRMSNLYKYSLEYSVFLLEVLAFSIFLFIFFSRISNTQKFSQAICNAISSYKSMEKNINKTGLIIFIIGVVGTVLMHLILGGATIFQENKISRLSMISNNFYAHYLGYLRVFLSYYIPIGYYVFKNTTDNRQKLIHFFAVIVSSLLLLLELNRGDFVFPYISLVLIECFPQFSKNKYLKSFTKFLIISIIFILFFGFIGNVRVETTMREVYKTDISTFYGVENKNSVFTWIYVYITSSLENFRDMFYNQTVKNHSYGTLLFYPFFQIFFKLSGSNLKIYSEQLSPYLWKYKGLSTSTFMKDALIDFGTIGIFIYIFAYFLLLLVAYKSFLRTKNIYSLLSYSMALNICLWSMFVNSFAIGTFVIGFLLFYFLSVYSYRIYSQ